MNFSEAKVMAEKCIKKPFIFMTQKRKHMLSSLITSAEMYALDEYKKSRDKSVCPVCGKGKPYIQRLLVCDNSGNCIGTAYDVHCDFCNYAPDGDASATIEEALLKWDKAVERIKKAQAHAKDEEKNRKEGETN